jgi:hypothetical protein
LRNKNKKYMLWIYISFSRSTPLRVWQMFLCVACAQLRGISGSKTYHAVSALRHTIKRSQALQGAAESSGTHVLHLDRNGDWTASPANFVRVRIERFIVRYY